MGAIEREPRPRIYRDRLITKMLMSNIRLIVTKEIMKFLFLPIKILNRDTKNQGIQGKHFKKSTNLLTHPVRGKIMGRARRPLEAGLGAHVKRLKRAHVRVTREHSGRALWSEHSQSLAPRNLGLIKNDLKFRQK